MNTTFGKVALKLYDFFWIIYCTYESLKSKSRKTAIDNKDGVMKHMWCFARFGTICTI